MEEDKRGLLKHAPFLTSLVFLILNLGAADTGHTWEEGPLFWFQMWTEILSKAKLLGPRQYKDVSQVNMREHL